MTVNELQYNTMKNVSRFGFRDKLAIFPRIDNTDFISSFEAGYSIVTNHKPCALISPPYATTPAGVGVTLYGGDSFERGGAAATGHTWILVSGSATLSPSGVNCTVTPTGGVGDVVIVKLTVTATNSNTNYRYAYIYTGEWRPGAIEHYTLTGNFDAKGWSGELVISDRYADFDALDQGKLILFHMTPIWDGVPLAIGGYKRAENVCLLRVADWGYEKSNQRTVISLESPAKELELVENYALLTDYDGDSGLIRYLEAASDATGDYRYRSDFALTDAVWDAVACDLSNVATHYNCTIWDDSNTLPRVTVHQASIRTQLIDIMKSIVGEFFCNFTGSLQMFPDRVVRADEYWGTPAGIWDSSKPLIQDFLFAEGDPKAWRMKEYDTDRIKAVILTGQKFNANKQPVDSTIIVGNAGAGEAQVYRKAGVYFPDTSTPEDWANDMLAQANYQWDLDFTMLGSNVLNVADTVYVNLFPDPDGLSTVGLDDFYIKTVRHQVSGRNGPFPTWITDYHAEQVTARA